MTTYTKTKDGELVGHKMVQAVQVLDKNGGVMPAKLPLAEKVGPHGSRGYGYRIVDRCQANGLVKISPRHEAASPHGIGAVVLTDKGRALARTSDR